MLNWFKKLFVPHEANGHKPSVLLRENLGYIVVIVLILELLLFIAPTFLANNRSNFLGAVLPGVLSSLTNQNRLDNKLAALKENPILDQSATLKAQDMAAKGYFAHVSPVDGKTPWYWFNQVGYKYNYAGENLAINFTDSQDVDNAWMNSPTHRANILKQNYTEFGTGIATGTYQGQDTVFIAQDFAKPYVAGKVLGAETESSNVKTSNATALAVATFITSPHNSTNVILIIIGSLILLAILIGLFMKLHTRHPRLITDGLIVIVIILAVMLVNNYFGKKNTVVYTADGGNSSDIGSSTFTSF